MYSRILLGLSALLLAAPSFTPPVAAAPDSQIQRYQRKYISFFYPQDYPLNEALANAFQRGFPRFDYHLISTSLSMSFDEFLDQTRAYQEKVAGDIAAGREVKDPRFGDKVVSWSETQKIAKSAYVFVPVWKLGEISIDGPYATDTSKPLAAAWKIDAKSDASVKMAIWNLAGNSPQKVKTISDSWTVTRNQALTIPLDQVILAAQQYNRTAATKDQIKLSESLSSTQREGLLKHLRENTRLNQQMSEIEEQDPYTYMMPSAVKSIGYGSVIGSIQRMDEFLIRAEVDNPDMQKDRVSVKLGEGETAKSLGIGLDSGYKLVEYVKGESKPREIGYMKIREIDKSTLFGQPIIVGRDFELGDQIVEYPKAGFGINLRGGVNLDGSFSKLGGGGGIDLDFDIGPAFGVSELYFDLSGGYFNSYFLIEAGLYKKWYWRQLFFDLGLRAGGSIGDEKLSAGTPGAGNGFGATGMLGLGFQATPDIAFGIDTGWRQYSNLSGPLLEAYLRFDL